MRGFARNKNVSRVIFLQKMRCSVGTQRYGQIFFEIFFVYRKPLRKPQLTTMEHPRPKTTSRYDRPQKPLNFYDENVKTSRSFKRVFFEGFPFKHQEVSQSISKPLED